MLVDEVWQIDPRCLMFFFAVMLLSSSSFAVPKAEFKVLYLRSAPLNLKSPEPFDLQVIYELILYSISLLRPSCPKLSKKPNVNVLQESPVVCNETIPMR